MKRDDYWSIDKLLPKIHTAPSFPVGSNNGISISLLDEEDNGPSFGEAIIPKKSRCILSYRLSDEVMPKSDLILHCDLYSESLSPLFQPCSAFSPSLLSLSDAQRKYFFYFLNCIKEKKAVEASYPYLQLFLCRMIRIPLWQKEDYNTILWVWSTYRRQFPLTDKLFSDVISDYCFYRRIEPDYEALSPILTREDMTSRPFLITPFLFDYLFSEEHKFSPEEMNFVLRTVTLQSFRKSKAYRVNKTFAAASESVIKKAFDAGLYNRADLNRSLYNIQIPSKLNTKRKLFALLPKEEVPDLEIDLSHIPFLHDENIRDRCDELIRYLENRIRKILKMKNTLSRIHISAEHRAFLEGLLLEYEALAPRPTEEETVGGDNVPSLPPRELEVDLSLASQIEEDSWVITASLTESYTKNGEESILIGGEEKDSEFDQAYAHQIRELEKVAPADLGEFWEFASLLEETEDEFIRTALHEGPQKARLFAQGKGMFFDALILSCNRKAEESVADAIFDPTGQIYPDYKEALQDVFPPLKGE